MQFAATQPTWEWNQFLLPSPIRGFPFGFIFHEGTFFTLKNVSQHDLKRLQTAPRASIKSMTVLYPSRERSAVDYNGATFPNRNWGTLTQQPTQKQIRIVRLPAFKPGRCRRRTHSSFSPPYFTGSLFSQERTIRFVFFPNDSPSN